ncbi:hypothetical protein J6590_103308 [Homalodisca vitripennis]|nr:hypothetical protein J6590_103308 [Homalodisca vitripennis]
MSQSIHPENNRNTDRLLPLAAVTCDLYEYLLFALTVLLSHGRVKAHEFGKPTSHKHPPRCDCLDVLPHNKPHLVRPDTIIAT